MPALATYFREVAGAGAPMAMPNRLLLLSTPPLPPRLYFFPAGVNVRHRAKEILQLVNDPQRLREEREKVRGEVWAFCTHSGLACCCSCGWCRLVQGPRMAWPLRSSWVHGVPHATCLSFVCRRPRPTVPSTAACLQTRCGPAPLPAPAAARLDESPTPRAACSWGAAALAAAAAG